MDTRPSPVRSTAPARTQGTAVIKRTQAAALLRFLTRLVAVVLLYGSWLGSSLLIAGTAPVPWWQLWQLPIAAIWIGFAIQAPITLAEFANRHRRSSWAYRAPFLVDAATTFLGYRPIAVPWFLGALSNDGSLVSLFGASSMIVVAHLVALAFSLFVARFPELVLVDD